MMNFFKKRLNKKGFTLVELLIVIAVLGIIAGIGVTSMSGVTDTFKKKADIETGRIYARQIEIMVMSGELTPTSSEVDVTDKITDIKKPQSAPDKEFGIFLTKVDDDESTVTIKVGTEELKDIKISSKEIK